MLNLSKFGISRILGSIIQVPDITNLLERIYNAIELILPYLIPFMNIVQPFISGFGNFLRSIIAPLYDGMQLPPNYYLDGNFLIFYVIAGIILLFALFSAIKWPLQRNIRLEEESGE